MKKYIIPPGSLKHGVVCADETSDNNCGCEGMRCNDCVFGTSIAHDFNLTQEQISTSYRKIWKECNTSE